MTDETPTPQHQSGPPQPEPVPTAWALGYGPGFVAYQWLTPTGTFVAFLTLEDSERLADGIKAAVLQAKTGLTIAGADEMPREAPGGGVLLGR